MTEPRVTIKRATLELIRRLLEEGNASAALDVCREALDDFRQQQLRWCKDEVYHRYKAGKLSWEAYRELWEYADQFLR